ncbi:MAG: hypothetical protein IJH43_01940 [Mogibacterium sp.]|nr:hypothetical protein [Mogibacterium sp.]
MKKYQWVITIVSIFLMYGNKLIPPFPGLSSTGMSILCIFAGTMMMLLFVSLTWPVVLSVLSYAVCGVYALPTAISMSFGHHIFWFVAFSGMIMSSLNREGMLRRLAIWMISRPFARKSPWVFLTTYFFVIMLVGSIMDVTAATILFSGLTAEMLYSLDVKKGDRFGEIIMLGVHVICGLSYGITPICHSVPILAMSLFSDFTSTNFLHYCIVGYVCGTLILIAYILSFKFILKLDISILAGFDARSLEHDFKPLSKRDKSCAFVYGFIIVLWILPSLLQNLAPAVYTFFDSLTSTMPMLLGVIIMCLWHVDGKPLMDFGKELNEGVPWVACFPMAAAMMIAVAMNNEEGGIPAWIAGGTTDLLSNVTPFMFVFFICIFCTVITNFASDTVALVLASSVATTLMAGGALDISGLYIPGLAIALGVVASCAYATPAGSTYGALISGQGWVSRKCQFIDGMLYAMFNAVVCATLGYFLAMAIA